MTKWNDRGNPYSNPDDGEQAEPPVPSDSACTSPPFPPYPPFAPYPPYPPFPPYPPYPSNPPCPPCTSSPPYTPITAHGAGAMDGADGDNRPEGGGSGSQGGHGNGSQSGGGTGQEGDHSGGGHPHDSGSTQIYPPRVSVRRPDDLVVLDLDFAGFTLEGQPPRLTRARADAYIVLGFPPQCFGEEAFEKAGGQVFEPSDAEALEVTDVLGYPKKNLPGATSQPPTTLPLVRMRMAGASRVVVTMPAGVDIFGFDLASVLTALREWPMRLDGNAVPDPLRARLVGHLAEIATNLATAQAAVTAQTAATLSSGVVSTTASLSGGSTGPAIATTGIDLVTSAALEAALRLARAPHAPAADVTALELPYRLMISPVAPARWRHADRPVERGGRVELWHTRLTTAERATGPDAPSAIRALWSPDYRPPERIDELVRLLSKQPAPPTGPEPNPDLLRMSLDPLDRSMLVTLMAGFDALRDNGTPYQPRASEAGRLQLSSLGALLDAEGEWRILPADIDLQQWRHLATLGRDHYVRVMYAGYLCPFGHAASLVKVTERVFETVGGGRVALLRQRFFVAVREPVREYDGANHVWQSRNFPFRRVEIVSRVTPDLSDPGMGASALVPGPDGTAYGPGIAPRMVFWPMVPSTSTNVLADFSFRIDATDIAGERVSFAMPLLFVGKLADDRVAEQVKSGYNKPSEATRRQTCLSGAAITYAPDDPADPGATRLPTNRLEFRAGTLRRNARPAFYPEIDRAGVGVKPIQRMLAQPGFIAEVTFPDVFKEDGFAPGANAGAMFLQLVNSRPLPFGDGVNDAKSDALGALASPQQQLLGLSRKLGPVSGLAATGVEAVRDKLKEIVGGKFDPKQFFDGAKILGGVPLAEILDVATNLAGADVPKMISRELPDRIEATFDWATEVKKGDPLGLLIPHADETGAKTRLVMRGAMQTPLALNARPTASAEASLNNFKVNLFGCIIIWFERIDFKSKLGEKPEVVVRLRDGDDAVSFGGPLEFVNKIRTLIPSNGFSDLPGLKVTPSGISASYSLALPAVQVGVFALSNVTLGAGFQLPFDSRPASVKFFFAERQRPFSLTISLLGGGGFFGIAISTRGVQEIEAALEFGAQLAINLGVASGAVEIKAGIYFHWLEPIPDKGMAELSGYVRIHGELTVLAIISASLTFNLQLGYRKESGKSIAFGEATLVVEIEILFLSMSVSVSVRREFAGGDADPTFLDLIPTADVWREYCEAFAIEGAHA